MSLMHDQLSYCRRLRLFTAIYDINIGALPIEAESLMPATCAKRGLDKVKPLRGKPRRIRCDNGPEWIGE